MDRAFIGIKAFAANKFYEIFIHYTQDEIEKEYQSFLRPNVSLSLEEESRTNVSRITLLTAPTFAEIANQIIKILSNKDLYFINASTERILRSSFSKIGYPLRKSHNILYSQLKNIKSVNLGKSLESLLLEMDQENHNYDLKNIIRHLTNWYQNIQEINSDYDIPKNKIDTTYSNHYEKTNLREIPGSTGVYLFKNDTNEILYVGKSLDLKKRIESHFRTKNDFEIALCKATNYIEIEETGSELIALLVESKYIQQFQPQFNTQQKSILNPYILTYYEDSKGILRIRAEKKTYEDSEAETFFNKASVMKAIEALQKQFLLCKRYTSLERSNASCSDQIFCKGICRGEEDILSYNIRVKKALKIVQETTLSYYIKLKGRSTNENGVVLVKDGIYYGYGFIKKSEKINFLEDLEAFIISDNHTYFTTRTIAQKVSNKNFHSSNVFYF